MCDENDESVELLAFEKPFYGDVEIFDFTGAKRRKLKINTNNECKMWKGFKPVITTKGE